MSTLLCAYLAVVSIGLLVMMIVQFSRGKAELLSIRNFFLLGLIVFRKRS